MCGIIGIVGTQPVQDRLIESLKRLEYRGYDSAGIAAVVAGKVQRRRAEGKIRALEEVLAAEPLSGSAARTSSSARILPSARRRWTFPSTTAAMPAES